jgi:hypothetical protein
MRDPSGVSSYRLGIWEVQNLALRELAIQHLVLTQFGTPSESAATMSPSRKSWKQSGGVSTFGAVPSLGNRTLVNCSPPFRTLGYPTSGKRSRRPRGPRYRPPRGIMPCRIERRHLSIRNNQRLVHGPLLSSTRKPRAAGHSNQSVQIQSGKWAAQSATS